MILMKRLARPDTQGQIQEAIEQRVRRWKRWTKSCVGWADARSPVVTFFWFPLVFLFASLSILETYRMEIFGKGIFLVDVVVKLALVLGWVFGLLVFFCVFVYRRINPSVDRLFQGYGGIKKATAAALLFLGNVLVYFFSEESVACMLAFFFLACFWFCVLCCLQPYTDFGVLEFLLSACLNVALSVFGVRIHTWVVSIACILVILLRYFVDPLCPVTVSALELEIARMFRN